MSHLKALMANYKKLASLQGTGRVALSKNELKVLAEIVERQDKALEECNQQFLLRYREKINIAAVARVEVECLAKEVKL